MSVYTGKCSRAYLRCVLIVSRFDCVTCRTKKKTKK